MTSLPQIQHRARPALDVRTGAVAQSTVPQPALERRVELLLDRLRIGVVFGADKSAAGAVITPTVNSRSWKSYQSVAHDIADALRRIGFKHVSLLTDDMRLAETLRREGIHLVWLNTGGVQGINPMAHAPAQLEMLGVPYIGHDPLIAGMLDNKHSFKRNLASLGLPTAPFVTWHPVRGPFRPKVNSRFIRAFKNHWGPYVVKPVSGRASLHVHCVDDESGLSAAVSEVYAATENEVLIEAYLPGREYCIAVSGAIVARQRRIFRLAEPFVFSPVERVFAPGERIVTSMDVQPISPDRLRLLASEPDQEIVAELTELARAVHLDFNLEALVRLDVRTDARNRLAVLEANPKPDLKRPSDSLTSIVCFGLASQGMDYEDLILGQLANRLDFLMRHRRRAIPRLAELMA